MIPIIRPTLPPFEVIKDGIREIIETGMVTNGKYLRAFENEAAEYLGALEAIAVSSCTTGLMLVMSELPRGSQVIMPGFTFSGTYQGAQWNDLDVVPVDCDESCNIDPGKVEAAVTEKTSAIVGVHMAGVPCDIDKLTSIAARHRLKLFFDAAHAFGSEYKGTRVGNFGDAEVFSLGATKVLAVGEGGLIATNSRELAKRMRLAANHGHGVDDLDCCNKALNGRLEEFNALLGLEGLKYLEGNITRRNQLAALYREKLTKVAGISFPHVPVNVRTTVKDFSIFIDEPVFGMSRDQLALQLKSRGIQSKKYYHPPLHRLAILKEKFRDLTLPNTELKAATVLTLPLFSHMADQDVLAVCDTLAEAQVKCAK